MRLWVADAITLVAAVHLGSSSLSSSFYSAAVAAVTVAVVTTIADAVANQLKYNKNNAPEKSGALFFITNFAKVKESQKSS